MPHLVSSSDGPCNEEQESVMAIVLGCIAFVVTVIISVIILFAGNMRTTGGNSSDAKQALGVFVVGSIVAVSLIITHFHPVSW